MHRILCIAVVASAVAGPGLAATCSQAPSSKYQSQDALKQKLANQGMEVRQIKTEGGCYEVYAIDQSGKQVNVAFNAETLAPVEDAEAGEE